jgi:hypothetical protein
MANRLKCIEISKFKKVLELLLQQPLAAADAFVRFLLVKFLVCRRWGRQQHCLSYLVIRSVDVGDDALPGGVAGGCILGVICPVGVCMAATCIGASAWILSIARWSSLRHRRFIALRVNKSNPFAAEFDAKHVCKAATPNQMLRLDASCSKRGMPKPQLCRSTHMGWRS